jgi:NADH-quinone oxidoreductase subunit J
MPMSVDWIVFLSLAVVSVASAIGMLLSKSAIYSAINLIINLITMAAFYLLLGAPFLSMAQVTVYAGAIMVLFLFVIMMLGSEQSSGQNLVPWQTPLSILLSVILIGALSYLLLDRSEFLTSASKIAQDFGSPEAIGLLLFNAYLLPFEVIGILLLAAMIGAIVLTRRPKRLDEALSSGADQNLAEDTHATD